MLHMIFSQCSLQRPSVLRMNTMISSTEGSQGNCWECFPAADKQLSTQDNDVITYHDLRHAPPKVGDIVRNIRLLNFFFFCLFCLDANWVGWLTEEESKPSFKWCSTSLLYVSWLFGTLTVKAKVFFVHRYWFIQLFLSKCFYSTLLFF